ncbi:MAG: hypothetical protein JSV31_00995 [Desulfobacterales bacterium]|nr:MAG: hypothetical protein JSV31_00995 [Desulfobacterales bacterium]
MDFMKYCLSTIAIAFIIISCSHGKTIHFPEGKELNNPVEVTVIRNRNLFCGAESTTILFDGLPIAHIRRGEYVSFFVESGVHFLKVRQNGVYGNFKKGKKYYFLISINFFDMIDNYIFGDSCGFEIEKISEEKGLERIKRSKNLIEMEKAHESAAVVSRTESEPKKKAYSFNPEEPWTGRWQVTGYRSFIGTWALKQIDNKVVSTENSACQIESLAVGDQLKGKIIGSYKVYPFTIKISSDGQSFKGTSTDYYGRSVHIKGERK